MLKLPDGSQKGVYWLPPELVTQLRDYLKKHKIIGEDLAFRTREGRPLVTDSSAAVRQAWKDWRVRSGVEHCGLGFYSLLRFFGDCATRHGGDSWVIGATKQKTGGFSGLHFPAVMLVFAAILVSYMRSEETSKLDA